MKYTRLLKASNHELVDSVEVYNLTGEDKAELRVNVKDYDNGAIKPFRNWLIDNSKIQEARKAVKQFNSKWEDYLDDNFNPKQRSRTGSVWKDLKDIINNYCLQNI